MRSHFNALCNRWNTIKCLLKSKIPHGIHGWWENACYTLICGESCIRHTPNMHAFIPLCTYVAYSRIGIVMHFHAFTHINHHWCCANRLKQQMSPICLCVHFHAHCTECIQLRAQMKIRCVYFVNRWVFDVAHLKWWRAYRHHDIVILLLALAWLDKHMLNYMQHGIEEKQPAAIIGLRLLYSINDLSGNAVTELEWPMHFTRNVRAACAG